MKIDHVAKLCHEANRSYCQTVGDASQPTWEEAPDWQRLSALNGVKYHLENPTATPTQSHEKWLEEKVAAGWVYGDVKDPEKKTHPCVKPYAELPENQKVKDYLFSGIIKAVRNFVTE